MAAAEDPQAPRQGDYFPHVRRLHRGKCRFRRNTLRTPLGVVLVTQCCDAARPDKGEFQVAPVVALDRSEHPMLRRSSRYFELPHTEAGMFADLGHIAGMARRELKGESVRLETTQQRLDLQATLRRRFGRFAFPEPLNPVLSALRQSVRDKADRTGSPFGRALQRIDTIRLASREDWEAPPWDLTLILVVGREYIPSLPDDAVGPPEQTRAVSRICQEILNTKGLPPKLGFLWIELSEALAASMSAAATKHGIDAEVVGEAASEDELTVQEYKESVDVDLDDLSDPSPE